MAYYQSTADSHTKAHSYHHQTTHNQVSVPSNYRDISAHPQQHSHYEQCRQISLSRSLRKPSHALGSLISRFEALDSVDFPCGTSSLQPALYQSVSRPRDATGPVTQRQWSTIFSPRPLSRNKYNSLIVDEKWEDEREDRQITPPSYKPSPQKNYSSSRRSGRTPSPIKTSTGRLRYKDRVQECPGSPLERYGQSSSPRRERKVWARKSRDNAFSVRDRVKMFDTHKNTPAYIAPTSYMQPPVAAPSTCFDTYTSSLDNRRYVHDVRRDPNSGPPISLSTYTKTYETREDPYDNKRDPTTDPPVSYEIYKKTYKTRGDHTKRLSPHTTRCSARRWTNHHWVPPCTTTAERPRATTGLQIHTPIHHVTPSRHYPQSAPKERGPTFGQFFPSPYHREMPLTKSLLNTTPRTHFRQRNAIAIPVSPTRRGRSRYSDRERRQRKSRSSRGSTHCGLTPEHPRSRSPVKGQHIRFHDKRELGQRIEKIYFEKEKRKEAKEGDFSCFKCDFDAPTSGFTSRWKNEMKLQPSKEREFLCIKCDAPTSNCNSSWTVDGQTLPSKERDFLCINCDAPSTSFISRRQVYEPAPGSSLNRLYDGSLSRKISTQFDAPVLTRKPSKVAGMRALFDGGASSKSEKDEVPPMPKPIDAKLWAGKGRLLSGKVVDTKGHSTIKALEQVLLRVAPSIFAATELKQDNIDQAPETAMSPIVAAVGWQEEKKGVGAIMKDEKGASVASSSESTYAATAGREHGVSWMLQPPPAPPPPPPSMPGKHPSRSRTASHEEMPVPIPARHLDNLRATSLENESAPISPKNPGRSRSSSQKNEPVPIPFKHPERSRTTSHENDASPLAIKPLRIANKIHALTTKGQTSQPAPRFPVLLTQDKPQTKKFSGDIGDRIKLFEGRALSEFKPEKTTRNVSKTVSEMAKMRKESMLQKVGTKRTGGQLEGRDMSGNAVAIGEVPENVEAGVMKKWITGVDENWEKITDETMVEVLDGTTGGNMTVREIFVECGLKEPKPLRVTEMKRMILLCRGKVAGAKKL
jgi:hypothetical protein